MRWPRSKREWGWTMLVAYSAALAVILLSPSADLSSSTVGTAAKLLTAMGVPAEWVAGARVEFALNALMVAPVPVLGWLVVPKVSPSAWVAALFGASLAVEAFQGLLLPGRSAQMADVVANTLGATLGAGVIVVFAHAGVRHVTKWAVFRRSG